MKGFLTFYFSVTFSCSLAGLELYIVVDLILHFLGSCISFAPYVYMYLIYVDFSYFFLSWSDSIQNTQGMERSTLLSQTLSFIRILNHFKKMVSPVLLFQISLQFIYLLFFGWLLLNRLIIDLVVSHF